jgi:hypothetical protein
VRKTIRGKEQWKNSVHKLTLTGRFLKKDSGAQRERERERENWWVNNYDDFLKKDRQRGTRILSS